MNLHWKYGVTLKVKEIIDPAFNKLEQYYFKAALTNIFILTMSQMIICNVKGVIRSKN